MLPLKAIGQHLHDAREQLNLTQGEVAHRAGISLTFYGRLERGEAKPSIDCIFDLCTALQLSVQDMFRDVILPNTSLSTRMLPEKEALQYLNEVYEGASQNKKILMMSICYLIDSLKD